MKKVIIMILSIIVISFIWTEYRHFYNIKNMTFTVWKKSNGKCYITPYRYWGLKLPSKNYIIVPNLGSITFCIKEDSLIIFNEGCSECSANENENFECHLTNYKYSYIESEDYEYIRKMRRKYLENFPYISIAIDELYVFDKKDRGYATHMASPE